MFMLKVVQKVFFQRSQLIYNDREMAEIHKNVSSRRLSVVENKRVRALQRKTNLNEIIVFKGLIL